MTDRELLRQIERAPGQRAGYKHLVRILGLGGGRERRVLLEQLARLTAAGRLVKLDREQWELAGAAQARGARRRGAPARPRRAEARLPLPAPLSLWEPPARPRPGRGQEGGQGQPGRLPPPRAGGPEPGGAGGRAGWRARWRHRPGACSRPNGGDEETARRFCTGAEARPGSANRAHGGWQGGGGFG